MGQEFGKCVKTDSVDDGSDVYKKCTPEPSTANGSHDGGRKKYRFWRRKKGLKNGQVQATEVMDVAPDRNTEEFQENQEILTCDLEILGTQDPVLSEPLVQVHSGSDSTVDSVQDPVLSEPLVQVHSGSDSTVDSVQDPVLSEPLVQVHIGPDSTVDSVQDPVLSEPLVQVHSGSDSTVDSVQDPVLSEPLVQVHIGPDSTVDSVQDPVLSEPLVQVHFGSDLIVDSVHDPVLSESLVQVHLGSDSTVDSVQDPVLSEPLVQVHFASDLIVDSVHDPVLSESLVQVHLGSDSNEDASQDPVAIASDWKEELDCDKEIQPESVSVAEEEMVVDEEPSVVIQEIKSCLYEIGEILSESAFGAIYEGIRVKDGLKVAVKRVNTSKHLDYIKIPGHPEPLPREVALHMLACKGEIVPEVVQLLNWQVYPDHYIMVLERPSPCVDVRDFARSNGGKLNEELAKDIMWQATTAAYKCLRRGVFHRDIKMEHLLITDTQYVKLIDFGCGDLLTRSSYKTFMGTRDYACPEFFKMGEYYGQPATVYSLGALLFAMVCGTFPNCDDRYSIDQKILSKDGLTGECCNLIEACLQEDPENRINLHEILEHKWFQNKYPADSLQIPVHLNEDRKDDQKAGVRLKEIHGCQYEIGRKLGQGGFGSVHEGTRLQDSLEVAVKLVFKTKDVIDDYINIPGHPEPLPREVGLQMLACEGEHVPAIIQLLDWEDYSDGYVMVLERPSPCMDLARFMKINGGRVTEYIAHGIMGQATFAAKICCQRGVFHRDIKLENLLINPDTLQVKMIDFGCGDLYKRSAYKEYMGTMIYTCPEYLVWGEYYGKPATVYSLGVLLFAMVCGRFPTDSDLDQINEYSWSKDCLTGECCNLIVACLQEDPEDRIDLEEILEHKWFQQEDPDDAGFNDD